MRSEIQLSDCRVVVYRSDINDAVRFDLFNDRMFGLVRLSGGEWLGIIGEIEHAYSKKSEDEGGFCELRIHKLSWVFYVTITTEDCKDLRQFISEWLGLV
jgi:hypothetical protein